MKPPGARSIVAIGLASMVLFACQDTPEPTQPSAAVAAVQHKLTISGLGNGNGVVTSSPAGINCNITAGKAAATGCTALFNEGSRVTLTARPASGHAFGAWGQHCSGRTTCVARMTVPRTVSAEFRKGPFTIQITAATNRVGNGRVTSQAGLTPAINCVFTNGTPAATGCSATYAANRVVTLTATPAAGFDFGGWPSPSCGTAACQYTIIQNLTIPLNFPAAGSSLPASEGRWAPAFTTPVVAVHVHLLPTGEVLLWGDQGQSQLWNPANPGAGFIAVSKTFRIYCSGHTFLPDGRLLVVGGTSEGTRGLKLATVFNSSSRSWGAAVSMAQGRYYPTTTTLPNGEILIVSGHNENLAVVTVPEVGNGNGWRRLTGAPLAIPDPFYPAMFVAPNGKVFLAGFQRTTRYLDIAGAGRWTTVAERKVADRRLGSAVMYAPGKILYAGGGDPPTNSAEVIDLNQASPSWQTVPGMAFARRQMNATLLADGSVLVTHGTSGAGFNNQAGGVRHAELWNPQTRSWKTMAREAKIRAYHSAALLLPSGQVLVGGSGEGGGVPYANSEFTAQLFSPPYLFNPNGSLAARPSIAFAPARIPYGQSFTVQTPNAGSVTRGTLIRLSSVTHAFNMSQLAYPVTFTSISSNSLRGTAIPAGTGRNLAPPGPYMLFLINSSGVPSVGRMVMVGP